MIPAQIATDIASLAASLQANAPISQATPLLKAAAITAGRALVAEIDDAVTATDTGLLAADPQGFAGALPNVLNGISASAGDQAALVSLRGTVGRALFNLEQA